MYFLKTISTLALLGTSFPFVQAGLENFDPNNSPTGEGCVDPQGFRDCFQTGKEAFVDCGENYCKRQNASALQDYGECLSGCGGIQLNTDISCWIQSCWNQVCSAP